MRFRGNGKADRCRAAREVFTGKRFTAGCSKPLALGVILSTLLRFPRSSVLVAAVAVDLAANLAAGPGRAVDVHVGGASADCFDQLVDFAGVQALSACGRSGRDVRADV